MCGDAEDERLAREAAARDARQFGLTETRAWIDQARTCRLQAQVMDLVLMPKQAAENRAAARECLRIAGHYRQSLLGLLA